MVSQYVAQLYTTTLIFRHNHPLIEAAWKINPHHGICLADALGMSPYATDLRAQHYAYNPGHSIRPT